MNESSVLEMESIKICKNKTVYFAVKRLFDIVVSFLLGIIFLIPLYIIIKIASILSKDFYPIIFTQNRIGKDGKTIKIYKFRSMIPNAEDVLEVLMRKDPKIRKEYLENKKLENDPRITKVGKFIRRYSIDELPQLLNVFIGNMSLVGPRPYLFREKEDMGNYYDYIIKCKPGITGLWQVSGRSNVSFKKRLLLDRDYTLNRGINYDLKIILKTVGAVIGKKGAK